jgi:hypothetical protein
MKGRLLVNSIAKKTFVVAVFLMVFGLAVSLPAAAQNPRGSAIGPTTAKGDDHPGQHLHLQDVKPADNMYPVILHPEQEGQHHKDHTLDLPCVHGCFRDECYRARFGVETMTGLLGRSGKKAARENT